MLLAAYLDGQLDQEERASLETRLAADPAAADLLAASGQALAAGPATELPPGLLQRAKGVVREAPRAESAVMARIRSFFDFREQAAWASLALGLLVASVVGFELGHIGLDHAAMQASIEGSETAVSLDTMDGPLL